MVMTSEKGEPPVDWPDDIEVVLDPMMRSPLWPKETGMPLIEMGGPPGRTGTAVCVAIASEMLVLPLLAAEVAVGTVFPLSKPMTKPVGLAVIVILSRMIVVGLASGIVLVPMTNEPLDPREKTVPDTVMGAAPGRTVRVPRGNVTPPSLAELVDGYKISIVDRVVEHETVV
jgi:hypothetical protein